MTSLGHKQTGFTIVELLIVIVVIAILAAISIVAYNGIQDRARNNQVLSGVNIYHKALLSYRAVNSSYPSVSGCLGANYPSSQCWVGPNGTWAVNSTLDANLSEFIPSKPTLATSLMAIHTGTDTRAGLLYTYVNSTSSRLVYYLKGSGQACTISGASGGNEGNTTQCIINFTS